MTEPADITLSAVPPSARILTAFSVTSTTASEPSAIKSSTRTATLTSTTITTSNISAVEAASSTSSSSALKAPVVGAVSSIGAVILAAFLAWFLVRRKTKREEREREKAGKDEFCQPAPYSVPGDHLLPTEPIKQARSKSPDLRANAPADVYEAYRPPSELHGSLQLEVPQRRTPRLLPSPRLDNGYGQKSVLQIRSNIDGSSRESQMPEGIIELPA